MPMCCCVLGCQNKADRQKNISLFRFPRNKDILDSWISFVGRTNWQPTNTSRICSLHFNNDDYYRWNDRLFLKPGVLPRKCIVRMSDNKENFDPFKVLNDKLTVNSSKRAFEETLENAENFKLQAISTESFNEIEILKERLQHDRELHQQELKKQAEMFSVILENEKSKLKSEIKSGLELHQQELKRQAEIFSTILENEKSKFRSKIESGQQKLHTLQRSVKRKEEQIKSMKHLFDELKKKYVSDTDALNMLSREFEGMSLNLFQNEVKNNSRSASGRRYSEEVKKFAVTLFYNSPKAYDYCRGIFNLSHPSSIRHWHSSVNAEPGFHKEIILFLKNLPAEDKDCNMIFDSMSIRQQLLWNVQEGKLVGYVDYGNDIHIEEKDSLANESLVFMLVALNGKWKWPIAYFLKKSLSAATLAELILTALSLTSNSELKVRSITCDGASVNISALNKLGCSIYVNNYESIVNSFKHPTQDYNVYVILDACHMLKLARNALADFKEFHTNDGNIEWRYIIQLHQLQNQLTFRFKNKLNSQCINWWQNKMKVKYAAQTLSSSVATIEFLKEYCPEFQDSEATITFKVIDRLFDFMNSRHPFGKGFHTPINRNNINALETIMIEKISFLFSLKTKTGDMLCLSGRRTFICGMATTVKSIFAVAKDIFSERESFKYILTYKFSQDYLEIFFSKIRSRHGYNNNPNVLQFKYAMRQILLRNEIRGSPNSNCLHLDSDPSGTMYQFIWKKKKQQNAIFESMDDESDNEIETFNNDSLSNCSTLKEYILFYIAGYIIKKLLSQIDCYTCAINLQK